ncbi:MAG TPA: ATP-binding protein [Candidatus Pacearchaeota archaeon]|nr:ATP-binding protein [Candidatus Pacearchaeota archaeon]HOS12975.1 ATP-binding protein [Candidatus Pacearchaeota archaeon]HPL72888.1 ATP-binding protein [Candidatus Pacearchaeota archaeon]
MINRKIEKNIVENLFKGKVIIIYGARQVGKTTLVKKIADDYKGQSSYFNCDLISVQDALSIPEANRIKDFLGDHNIIILDEAQRIKNIRLILKILIDTYPELQIIATGSSSFDLANEINEPLTGRKIVFNLFPLSVEEIMGDNGFLYIDSKLEKILRYGTYPDVFFSEDKEAASKLEEIASSYLFKDILSFDKIKKSSIIVKLLQLLALQVGSEVSYNELATKLGINRITVEKYIDILEQCFILFRINSFSRNLRNEISKAIKIYFYDLGVRNILIKNLNPLDIRNDAGFLWENFCILERIKRNKYNNIFANYYFWRTYDQKEIDFIEERDGKLFAYEFKLNKEHSKAPSIFLETYKNSQYQTINRENYYKFLI